MNVDIKSNIKKFLGVPSAARKSITREGILVMNPQNIVRLKNLGYSNRLIGKMAGVSGNTIWRRVQELKGQYKSLNKTHGQKKEKSEKEEEVKVAEKPKLNINMNFKYQDDTPETEVPETEEEETEETEE